VALLTVGQNTLLLLKFGPSSLCHWWDALPHQCDRDVHQGYPWIFGSSRSRCLSAGSVNSATSPTFAGHRSEHERQDCSLWALW